MTPKTDREKLLLSTLPALGLMLFGWLIFLNPADRAVKVLRRRVEGQGPLSAKQAQIARAKTDHADLQRALESRLNAPSENESVFDRNFAMQQVSQLCAAQRLSLNAATLDAAAQLPPSLREATALLTRNGNTTPPQVWKIELTGSYVGIVNLLHGLEKTKPLIVPLNLSMQTGKNERQPLKWVLTLWL